MSSGQPDVIQIVESEAELRTDQRVGWWVHFTCYTIGLEAKDSCCNIVNIVSPAGYYGVAVYFCAGNSSSCKRFFKRVPSFFVGYFLLQTNAASFADKSVFSPAAK